MPLTLMAPALPPAPGMMPNGFAADLDFALLVREADVLRVDLDGPTPSDLAWRISDDEIDQVTRFARTLLWLAADDAHTAPITDVVPPACLTGWLALDIATLEDVRRLFAPQLVGEVRFAITYAGREQLQLPVAA